MFDLWSPEHSVLREKVVEHIFLAELSKVLLLDLGQPFEVLRAEFDGNGYDVAIEAAGVLRHTQLKATARSGRRSHVDVQVALAEKPSGCVVWIFVDPATLALGPFLWFGSKPGRALPDLGDRQARHSRGNALGQKGVREGLRRLPKGAFTRFETIGELAEAMFLPLDHRRLLRDHLASRQSGSGIADRLIGLTWDRSAPLGYMIDGYQLADEAGIADPVALTERMRREADTSGRWTGTALELWLALFMEHRRDHFSGPVGLTLSPHSTKLLDDLCFELSEALASELG